MFEGCKTLFGGHTGVWWKYNAEVVRSKMRTNPLIQPIKYRAGKRVRGDHRYTVEAPKLQTYMKFKRKH